VATEGAQCEARDPANLAVLQSGAAEAGAPAAFTVILKHLNKNRNLAFPGLA